MAASVALSNLIIHPANKQQRAEVIKHVTNHWGSPEAGLDHFVRVHDIIENKEFGKDGKLTHWVLVPQDDRGTLDFYSCCRTYRRDIIALHAGSDTQQTAIGYVVSGVVTPPNHRRRGYAQRMISLLHYALAPTVHSSPDINIKIPPSVLPATVVVLYSDIGNYYSRCGPPGSPGFTITSPVTTTWNLATSISKLRDHTPSSAPVELLSEEAEAWNVSEELKEVVETVGGTTGNRKGHLPAMLWYGPRKNEDIVWSMNE